MYSLRLLVIASSILAIAGCEEGNQDDATFPEPDVQRNINDQFVPNAPDSDVNAQDMSPLMDMGALTEVTDCRSLCVRLRECGTPLFGDTSQCEQSCQDVSTYEGFESFVSCIDDSTCDSVTACRVPEAPPPTCLEVCSALDSCEPANRLPSEFQGIETCESACDVPAQAEALSLCGRSIAEGISTCEGDEFSVCLAERLYPVCDAVCERKLECGAINDYINCITDCAAPSDESDPVVRRRARLRQTCWQTAPDCSTAQQCDEPAASVDYDPTALCGADLSCSQIDSPCEERTVELSASIAHRTLDCLATAIDENCDTNVTSCFTDNTLDPLDCDEYCAVAMLCEQLPVGQSEFDCSSACRSATSGSVAERARFQRPTTCAYVNSCDELQTCLAQSNSTDICTAACEHIDTCQGTPADDQSCSEACNEATTIRQEVFYTCNAILNTCDAPSRCAVPPAPNCSTVCDNLSACNLERANCLQTCDDDAFLEPEAFLQSYACHAVSRNCSDTNQCAEGEYGGDRSGRACLQFCRGKLTCSGSQADMLTCIDECAQGFTGQEGLDFEQNFECLSQLPPDASCENIATCNASAFPESVCQNVCTARERCTLIEAGQTVDDCKAECVPAVENDPDAYACALRASRITNGCLDLAACLNIEIEPAAPECVSLCEARVQCDETADQFLCERQCDPTLDGTSTRLRCLEAYAECSDILACLDTPLEDPTICQQICTQVNACEGEITPGGRFDTIEDCQEACAIEALVNPEVDHTEVNLCLSEINCEAEEIERCLNGGIAAPTCENAWTAYEECSNDDNFLWAFVSPPVSDRASYIVFCEGLIASDGLMSIEPRLSCVIEAAANGMCDSQIACAF